MFGGEKNNDLLPWIEELVAKGKEVRPEHIEPDLWVSSAAILDLFWDLHSWRQSGGMGPAGITLSDIQSYCQIKGFMLKSFEVEFIKKVDNLFLMNYKTPPSEG